MRAFLAPAVLALAVGFSASAASAATMTGKIESINPKGHTFVVNKREFHANPHSSSLRLHNGQSVRVTYHWSHGHRMATEVKPA
jgi:hypothetical protein